MNTNQSGSWQPILDGELAARALDSIYSIAECLRTRRPSAGASLAGGHAGMALLFRYLALAQPGAGHETWAQHYRGLAMDALAGEPMWASFYGGFPGVVWAAQHLDGAPEPDAEDPAQEVDQAVLALLCRSPWRRDYDLVNGLVGLGVYALERLPRPAAAACLLQIVVHLEQLFVADPDGLRIHTPPELLRSTQATEYPHGYYNLGLAHGLPGILAVLGAIYTAGICRERARRLLLGGFDWLWAHRLPQDCSQERESVFPRCVGPGIQPRPAQTTWCYGDPGIAMAMLLAARAVGERLWEERALWLARQVAKRPPGRTGVVDIGLCHGAAGMGHLLNRLFQATGEEIFQESARSWFRRTLDMRDPERGLAGYLAYDPREAGADPVWIEDAGLLVGVSGIALSLLGALTPIEPAWDRMLLASFPVGSASAQAAGPS